MGFHKLTEILSKLRSQYPALSNRIKEAEALGRWEKAVGPQIAKHTRAVRVQDRCLWVEVDHPIWRSELHHRKRQILQKLNEQNPADAKAASATPPSTIEDLFFINPKGEQKQRP